MNFASLPMYDLPELAQATHAWWAGIATHMRRQGVADVPDQLVVPGDLETHWCAAELLLSQTCGYPLTHRLAGKVRLLGLPVYHCTGCGSDGSYSSLIVVPAGSDLRAASDCIDARAVYNTDDSMSGLIALRAAAAELGHRNRPVFRSLSRSGGHRQSLHLVARGEADVACIDAVTFGLLSRVDPDLTSSVRILGQTPRVPGLPLITSLSQTAETVERLRRALCCAMEDPALGDVRAQLLLSGITFPDLEHYDAILELEQSASTTVLV